jgi:hypothetical protein
VLFVAWGGGTLTDPGITTFLQDVVSYRHLPAQSGSRRLSPAAIIQFGGVGAGSEVLLLHPNSSTRLTPYIEEKAVDLEIPISDENPFSSPNPFIARFSGAHWVYFTWADSNIPLNDDTIENIDSEKLGNIGEILSHLLIQLVRQNYY